MELGKQAVASRQLDTAIELMFGCGDVVSVHTLASSACTVFRDLLDAKGEKTWFDEFVDYFDGDVQKTKQVMNRAANFFKHADRDADEVLELDERNNDETIIVATLEYGSLLKLDKNCDTKLTTPMSVFQVWYFAKAPEALLLSGNTVGKEIVDQAQLHFPHLSEYPRFHQLALGLERIRAERIRKRVVAGTVAP